MRVIGFVSIASRLRRLLKAAALKECLGAVCIVPATKAERPVSVQLADSRRDARQWARRAESDREIAQTRTVETRLTRAIAMGTFGLQLAANRAPEGCRKRGQRTARAIVLDPRVQQDRQAW